MEIIAKLALTAYLTIYENTQYVAVLTDFFEAKSEADSKKAEEQVPSFVRERKNRVEEWLFEGKPDEKNAIEKIAWIEQELTALIPGYMAKTHTVIGRPLDGLPIVYDSLESRYRHTFLIGRSGAGKSTVITNLVAQDMHKGYGVIVMSPDEDLMRRIAPYIPEHRLDDVIYFDPGDTTSPIVGFNPLFFETPSDPRDYDRFKRSKAGENYAVLMRTLNIDTDPTKNLLNHTMYALTGRANTTLNDLRRLIDPKERALHTEIANDSRVDTITREFWRNYATEGANAMVYRNLSSRIVPLLRPPLFDIFSTQSFSFHRELNERARILLIDLSNMGSRDSQEAKIASQLLIAIIHQTMLRRDKMKEADYIPYFMYIDEFQQYADTNENSISAMAEQIRKYHFGLTLTSLVVSDLSTALFDKITGVMSTFICLSMSAKDARRFADEMSIKHSGRDSFNYEALTKLKVGQAYVKTPPLDAAVFVHMPREPLGNLAKEPMTIQQLKNRSKANFGAMGRSQESAAEESDTQNEHVAEPTDPPPQIPNQTPKQPNRKKRYRFDDDAGDPLIEVS